MNSFNADTLDGDSNLANTFPIDRISGPVRQSFARGGGDSTHNHHNRERGFTQRLLKSLPTQDQIDLLFS